MTDICLVLLGGNGCKITRKSPRKHYFQRERVEIKNTLFIIIFHLRGKSLYLSACSVNNLYVSIGLIDTHLMVHVRIQGKFVYVNGGEIFVIVANAVIIRKMGISVLNNVPLTNLPGMTF